LTFLVAAKNNPPLKTIAKIAHGQDMIAVGDQKLKR